MFLRSPALPTVCAACLTAFVPGPIRAQGPGPTRAALRDQSFHTEVAPRLDPVFDGAGSLRDALEAFLTTERDMRSAHDAFSSAVQATLALLPARRVPARCPAEVAAAYRAAHTQGAQFLQLGLRLRELHRRITRADSLNETLALTPDYRWKAKQVGERYAALLRDYREMRVAFHEQLGTELRYAGCNLRALLETGRKAEAGPTAADPATPEAALPEDATAWMAAEEDEASAQRPAAGGAGARSRHAGRDPRNADPEPVSSAAAKAIWITIDNLACNAPSRLTIDAQPLGEIPPNRKVEVRARAGQRSLCLLPASDLRACGERGTLRKAYLYDGLTLTVHCGS